MSYVFDSGPLSWLFKHYYRKTFPSLWKRFDALVDEGYIISTREVLREVTDSSIEPLVQWASQNKRLFPMPTAAEGAFVGKIYAVAHFQQNIELQKLLKGGKVADPFIIAKAAVDGCGVITTEKLKPHAAKIPNICQHFKVPCLTLQEFMEEQDWAF